MILTLWILLHTTFFQNWIVKKVTATLSKNLNTTVSVRYVDFELFDKLLLQEALILDKKKDTLLYAGTVKVNITDWFFVKDTIVLRYAQLDNGFINVHRKDSAWNYQFFLDFLSGSKKAKKDTLKEAISLDIKIVELNNFTLSQKDEWIGQNVLISLKKFKLYTDDVDLSRNMIRLNTIRLDRPVFSQYNYKGLRPSKSPSITFTDTLKTITPGVGIRRHGYSP